MKVSSYWMSDVKSVAIQVLLFGGPIIETPDKNGITHFVEHIVLDGTKSYPTKREFATALEDLGVSYGGFTGQEVTGFQFDAPYVNMLPTLEILKEILFAPKLNEDFIKIEKGVIGEEMRDDDNNPDVKFAYKVLELRMKQEKHPLSMRVIGSSQVIEGLDRQKIMDYYQRQYIPSNMFLSITGSFDSQDLEGVLNRSFPLDRSDSSFVRPQFSDEDFSSQAYKIVDDPDMSNAYVNINYPAYSQNNTIKEKLAIGVLKEILGGLRTSRLFTKVREQKGLVYDIGASADVRWRLGTFDIYYQTEAKNISEIMAIIKQEIDDILANGVTEDEFRHTINYLNNRTLVRFSSVWNINHWIGEESLYRREVLFPEDIVAIRSRLTRDDIRDVAHEIFSTERVNVVVMGNVKSYNQTIEDSVRSLM